MADEAELRPLQTGPSSHDPVGNELLPGVSPAAAGGGAAEAAVELSGTPMGFVLSAEPPSGMYVRARYVDHHTAGYVWHRDDAEGHPASQLPEGDPAQVWWSHENSRWVSWQEILEFVSVNAQGLVLEPLFAPPPLPGCARDGVHNPARCTNPDPEMFRT